MGLPCLVVCVSAAVWLESRLPPHHPREQNNMPGHALVPVDPAAEMYGGESPRASPTKHVGVERGA